MDDRETNEAHGTNHQAGAGRSMLYASEGLISACGLVPSVFGQVPRIGTICRKSRILANSPKIIMFI